MAGLAAGRVVALAAVAERAGVLAGARVGVRDGRVRDMPLLGRA